MRGPFTLFTSAVMAVLTAGCAYNASSLIESREYTLKRHERFAEKVVEEKLRTAEAQGRLVEAVSSSGAGYWTEAVREKIENRLIRSGHLGVGQVVVAFDITEDGFARNLKIIEEESDGPAVMRQKMLGAVNACYPFAPLPEGKSASITLKVSS